MKLKELLTKVFEGHCERLPNESDNDFVSRCANSVYNPIGSVTDRSNVGLAMKKKIVVPFPIKRSAMKETIKKVGNKYVVYPKKGGKRLGTHSSLSSAKKQLAAIEINK
jgi:hypothetical protein